MTGASSIPIIAAIIVVAVNKRLINRFKDTGATNPNSARSLDELNTRRSLIFRRYVRRGILIEFNSRYYLDEQRLAEYKSKKRRILIPVIILLLAVLLFLDFYLTR